MKAVKCPVCDGSGKYKEKECHGCDGKGWVEVKEDCQPYPWYPYEPLNPYPWNPWYYHWDNNTSTSYAMVCH